MASEKYKIWQRAFLTLPQGFGDQTEKTSASIIHHVTCFLILVHKITCSMDLHSLWVPCYTAACSAWFWEQYLRNFTNKDHYEVEWKPIQNSKCKLILSCPMKTDLRVGVRAKSQCGNSQGAENKGRNSH